MLRGVLQIVLLSIVCAFYAEATDQVTQIDIRIRNHTFEPNVVTAATGQKLKLVITNQDDTVEEFESFDLKREKIVPAGGQINIILAPLPEGRYEFFGEFHQDTARGVLNIITNPTPNE